LGYDFTRKIQAGIGLITGGFLFTLGQELYYAGKEAVLAIPIQFAVPAVLGVAGFGLIAYDIWSRCRKNKTKEEPARMSYEDFKREQTKEELEQLDEDIQDPKAKSERDGKSRPSGIT